MNKRLERMIKDVRYTQTKGATLCYMVLKDGGVLMGFTMSKDMQLVDGVPLAHKLAYKDAYKVLEEVVQVMDETGVNI